MRRIAFAIGAVLVMGCSMPDGGDMVDLDRAVASVDALSREVLAEWALQKSIKQWLKKRPADDEVISFFCQKKNNDGTWTEQEEVFDYKVVVDDVLGVMLHLGDHYLSAINDLGDEGSKFLENEGLERDGQERKCHWLLLPQYQEDKVSAEATDRTEYRSGDYALAAQWMTVRMISVALITSDAPPPLPGFAPGGALVNLLPIMCALDAGSWGCPDNPKYPGGSPDK